MAVHHQHNTHQFNMTLSFLLEKPDIAPPYQPLNSLFTDAYFHQTQIKILSRSGITRPLVGVVNLVILVNLEILAILVNRVNLVILVNLAILVNLVIPMNMVILLILVNLNIW